MKKSKTFEEAMNELSHIVNQLEQGKLPLEESLEAFKRGIELSQFCQQTLNQAEQNVQKMRDELDNPPSIREDEAEQNG